MFRFVLLMTLFLSTNAFSETLENIYYSNGFVNEPTSFYVTIQINDRRLANRTDLWIQPEYAALNDTAKPWYPARQRLVVEKLPVTGTPVVKVRFAGLDETTMYRARIIIQREEGPQIIDMVTSPWYYTTTAGNDPKSIIRTRMILKGLKEFYDSERGLVGANGTVDVDGTRYGADPGELWCSEFYAWTAKGNLKNVDGLTSVKRITKYFTDHNGMMPASDIPEKARRGDYLSMDTDLNGDANHSGMFLAHEIDRTGQAFVWTLEGNSGNKVKVNRRPYDAVFIGLGHIMHSQY